MDANHVQSARIRNWSETAIWSELGKRASDDAETVRALLTTHMPLIEKILSAGGTSPLDFTLHDSGHAFRVAERMAQVIPGDTLSQLSTYELALLLFAAYLHDIGMTPERKLVELTYKFLLTGDQDEHFAKEQKELER
jgi:HD-GYP domain-containing protein (c-di-GMP phosphodiesterase class II)